MIGAEVGGPKSGTEMQISQNVGSPCIKSLILEGPKFGTGVPFSQNSVIDICEYRKIVLFAPKFFYLKE